MQIKTLAALQEARNQRRAVTLATRLGDAAEALVYLDTVDGALAGDAAIVAAARRLGDGQSLPQREGRAGLGRRSLPASGPRCLDGRRDADARSQARRPRAG